MKYDPIVACNYGPLNPKVDLLPDFFSDFVPEKRKEIVTEEASFYHSITSPYSVDDKLVKNYFDFTSFDGATVQVKAYRPRNVSEPLPALIFVHGGGFMTCSVETHDYVPSYLAANAKIMVFSVEYRLAPEYKYPTGLQDCWSAVQWVYQNAAQLKVNPRRISVGGDSSGGNFAAALALMAKKEHFVLEKQLLIYPVTDMTGTLEKRSSQVYTMVGGDKDDAGTNSLLQIYTEAGTDPFDALISPVFAQDLSGLPRALFIEAECDALLDDGLIYAKRLQDAGNQVECHIYEGMPHAFVLRTYEETFAALDTMCEFLK